MPLTPLPLPLALDATDQPMLLWFVVGALMALGPVLNSYIRVYEWFRGKSVDVSNFITRTEMQTMKLERDAQIAASVGEIKSDFDRLEKTLADISRDLPAIHRALGRLEGHDELDTRRRPRA